MGYVFDEMFFITPARLRLTGARAQVSVGWKEIYAVVEGSFYWDSNAVDLQLYAPPTEFFFLKLPIQ